MLTVAVKWRHANRPLTVEKKKNKLITSQIGQSRTKHVWRPRHTMRQVTATGCCNKSPRVTFENHYRCDRILSRRSVARIQTGLNSCDKSQRQNKRKQPCRSVCAHLRQIAATKFKSTNEGASISIPPCEIWTSLLFFSSKIDCVHQTSVLWPW